MLSLQLKEKISRLRPRRFNVYCVGAAKTGSTSLAKMLQTSYRSAHEPETEATNQMVIDWLNHSIDQTELQQRLIERDRRLNLEVESAHPLGYISDTLADCFPTSKFIITIREPYSWLESRLNFHNKFHPPAWEQYRDFFWTSRHTGYAPEESCLETYGLCSLDTYLHQYADHYSRVLSLPKYRSLLIRTSEINTSIAVIAGFLGVDRKTIEPSHSNQNSDKIEPLKEIEPSFVNAKIWQHCHKIITQYFPEQIHRYKQQH